MNNDRYSVHVWIDPYTQFQYELLEFFHNTTTSRDLLCDSNDVSPIARIFGFYIDGYFLLYKKALSSYSLTKEDCRFDELTNHLLLFIRNHWNPDKNELFEYLTNKTLLRLNQYINYYSNFIEKFYDKYSDDIIIHVTTVKYIHDLLLHAYDLLLDFNAQLRICNDHSLIHDIENMLHKLRLSMLNSKLSSPQIDNIEKKIYMNLYDSIIPILLFYRCFDD